MKAIICGGGTVGHITPGISIAEIIKEHLPQAEILFIGREGGDENRLIIHNGYKLQTIKISGFRRSFTPKNLETIFNIIKSLKHSREILTNFGPDIVIGTGGYVCWPIIKSAQKLGIPTLIHESNACPGLTTKLLASKCDRVLLNFPDCENEFKNKSNLSVVGNPIRKSLLFETRENARRKLRIPTTDFFILSFGGSGGSEIMNKNIISFMKHYSEKQKSVKHIHASGQKYFEQIKQQNPEFAEGKNCCLVLPFIENISTYLAAADIVICRCGAMTISEVCHAGCVPILIPSPNVTDNHQYKNGRKMIDKGCGIMIEENELNLKTLTDAVIHLQKNTWLRKKMGNRLSSFYKANCHELIYREIREITSK